MLAVRYCIAEACIVPSANSEPDLVGITIKVPNTGSEREASDLQAPHSWDSPHFMGPQPRREHKKQTAERNARPHVHCAGVPT